jgi:hypothetical protein
VTGSCAIGSTVRAINSDGSVLCWSDVPLHRANGPATNTIVTVDTAGDVGQYSSMTVGVDGLPIISYYDRGNANLKVLHCGNVLCNAGNIATTMDAMGDVGQYSSIAIGVDGLPVVSYYDASPNFNLKVLHCGVPDCSDFASNTVLTVDSTNQVGDHSSIAIGADGLPVIAYHYVSGSPSFVYALRVMHCGNVTCSGTNTTFTTDNVYDDGEYTSIAIGSDGLPVVSTRATQTLAVLHCGNVACNSGNLFTTVDVGSATTYTSLTIGADGLPVISYRGFSDNGLKAVHCGNVACSAGNTVGTLDIATASVGKYTAITLGADGLPIISYWDETETNLKVVHCSNALCLPYWRRR